MARKRKNRTTLPLSVGQDLYERARQAAAWEAQRTRIDSYGIATLAKQALLTRVEEIEAQQRQAQEAQAA